jgi:squalene cyclase
LGCLDTHGWWRDWDTQAGVSDEWVTAYSACALATLGDEGRARAERAFELLCSRRPARDGWAYNSHVPPDADSTVWVCRLANTLGDPTRVAPALAFLKSCLQPDGGIATYASAEGVGRSMRLAGNISFRGWLSSHACVTAAAAALPEFMTSPAVRAYLRCVQNPDGNWDGYWWPDAEYATALTVEALREHATPDDVRAIEAAVAWARARPDRSSAFTLACRIRILRIDEPRLCAELAHALLRLQNADGSWPSSARIRIPPPDVVNPASIWNWDANRKDVYGVRADHARLFTTATVLNALQLLL